jgi:hypothetical protein
LLFVAKIERRFEKSNTKTAQTKQPTFSASKKIVKSKNSRKSTATTELPAFLANGVWRREAPLADFGELSLRRRRSHELAAAATTTASVRYLLMRPEKTCSERFQKPPEKDVYLRAGKILQIEKK